MSFITGYVIGLSQVAELGFTDADRLLLQQLAAGNLGTGPRVITFTITNGTTPIQGASVSISKPGSYNNGVTDVNGQVVFGVVDSPDYVYAVVAQGFVSNAGAIAVDGNMARTVVMTQQVIPSPSQPNEVTVFVGTNPPTKNIEITLNYETPAITTSDLIPTVNLKTATTNDDGVASFSTTPSSLIRPSRPSDMTHKITAKIGDENREYTTRVPDGGGDIGGFLIGVK